MKFSYFKLKAILSMLLILSIGSCSVEKRIYNKGYTVQWKTFKNNHTSEKQTEKLADSKDILETQSKKRHENKTVTPNKVKTIVKNIQKDKSYLEMQSKMSIFNYNIDSDTLICEDILTKKNGERLKVKIHSIEAGVIRFQRCDDNKSGYYYIKTSLVESVIYENEVKNILEKKPEEKKSYTASDKKIKGSFDFLLILSLIFSTLAVLTLFMPFSTLPLFLSISAILTGVYSIQRILSSSEFKGLILAILSIAVSLYILVISLWLLNFI